VGGILLGIWKRPVLLRPQTAFKEAATAVSAQLRDHAPNSGPSPDFLQSAPKLRLRARQRDEKENYADPDFKKIASKCMNRISDGIGMYTFVEEENIGGVRSIERMLGAFKYIMYHMTGKPY